MLETFTESQILEFIKDADTDAEVTSENPEIIENIENNNEITETTEATHQVIAVFIDISINLLE